MSREREEVKGTNVVLTCCDPKHLTLATRRVNIYRESEYVQWNKKTSSI